MKIKTDYKAFNFLIKGNKDHIVKEDKSKLHRKMHVNAKN